MGGNSAWKRRVASGGLAKEGSGGAIARHRPRWGRKGADLKLNRKGNIKGGNPKKQKSRKSGAKYDAEDEELETGSVILSRTPSLNPVVTGMVVLLAAVFCFNLLRQWPNSLLTLGATQTSV